MTDGYVEDELKREVAVLAGLIGDTRVRYRQRKTSFASVQKLIEVDREIRFALARPLSPELQVEVRDLTTRLRALDPH